MNKNWYQGHMDPYWNGEYKDLMYINEPFNDPVSLKEWRNLGFTQTKFTGDMYDMRQTEPKWMVSVQEALPWKYFSWSVYRMNPGSTLPMHGDTYARFRELYAWDGDIHRAVIYMEDWQSGHISEIEDTVITDWRAGDYVVWKNDTQHLAANVGKTARYTLQITGVIE
jgi:hypothetical protein|tara:strand:+ start:1177 stop:1680 length:504 start_codon:yes stop_codon:yes gene_type:complete